MTTRITALLCLLGALALGCSASADDRIPLATLNGVPVDIEEVTSNAGEGSVTMTELATDPDDPATGRWTVYFLSTGLFYVDDTGTVVGPLAAPVTDHGALTGLSDDDHPQYLLADGTRSLSADWDAGAHEIRAETFESDVATGTAPLTVASTTVVSNLNADLLDGQEGSYYLDSDNFSGTEWTDLTDLGATTLHTHDHGSLDGNGDDDHAQYALLAGRSGGQTLYGGTGGSDDLTLQGDSSPGGGYVVIGDGRITSPGTSTGEQFGSGAQSTGSRSSAFGLDANAGDSGTAVGDSASASGTGVAVGVDSSATGTGVAVGEAASASTGEVVFPPNTADAYPWGKTTTDAGGVVDLYGPTAAGTNQDAPALQVNLPVGTGSGDDSTATLSVYAGQTGASGTIPHSRVEIATLSPNGDLSIDADLDAGGYVNATTNLQTNGVTRIDSAGAGTLTNLTVDSINVNGSTVTSSTNMGVTYSGLLTVSESADTTPEMQLGKSGDTTFSMSFGGAATYMRMLMASTSVSFDLLGTSTGNGLVRFFRDTNTSGNAELVVFDANGANSYSLLVRAGDFVQSRVPVYVVNNLTAGSSSYTRWFTTDIASATGTAATFGIGTTEARWTIAPMSAGDIWVTFPSTGVNSEVIGARAYYETGDYLASGSALNVRIYEWSGGTMTALGTVASQPITSNTTGTLTQTLASSATLSAGEQYYVRVWVSPAIGEVSIYIRNVEVQFEEREY